MLCIDKVSIIVWIICYHMGHSGKWHDNKHSLVSTDTNMDMIRASSRKFCITVRIMCHLFGCKGNNVKMYCRCNKCQIVYEVCKKMIPFNLVVSWNSL